MEIVQKLRIPECTVPSPNPIQFNQIVFSVILYNISSSTVTTSLGGDVTSSVTSATPLFTAY